MIKIEVTDKSQLRTITVKRTGEMLQLTEQQAYAHLPGGRYPAEIKVTPPKGEKPYPPGVYQISPESIWVNRYGQLELTPKLIPLAVGQQQKAA